jgi:hypothetical protein
MAKIPKKISIFAKFYAYINVTVNKTLKTCERDFPESVSSFLSS